jgi:hypothetical protein
LHTIFYCSLDATRFHLTERDFKAFMANSNDRALMHGMPSIVIRVLTQSPFFIGYNLQDVDFIIFSVCSPSRICILFCNLQLVSIVKHEIALSHSAIRSSSMVLYIPASKLRQPSPTLIRKSFDTLCPRSVLISTCILNSLKHKPSASAYSILLRAL